MTCNMAKLDRGCRTTVSVTASEVMFDLKDVQLQHEGAGAGCEVSL